MTTTGYAPADAPVITAVDVEIRLEDNSATATVRGTVDFHSVTRLRTALLHLVGADIGELVVDLRHAELADSTGPAALVHVRHDCRRAGILLSVITEPDSETHRALRSCGLLGALHVVAAQR